MFRTRTASSDSGRRPVVAARSIRWWPGFTRFRVYAGLGLVFLIFIGHVAYYGRYIVDDALISYAYGRSLVHHGELALVAGWTRVWGYSNFLWVLVLSWVETTGLTYDIGAKLVSVALALASLTMVWRLSGPRSSRLALLAPLLLSLWPAFVIWQVGGLENPLYVFLLLAAAMRYQSADWRLDRWSGVLLAAAAATRPEGAMYGMVFFGHALLAGLVRLSSRRTKAHARTEAKAWSLALCWFMLPLLLYLYLHLSYFGALVPNTFNAKSPQLGAASADELLSLLSAQSAGGQYLAGFWTAYKVPMLVAFLLLGTITAPLPLASLSWGIIGANAAYVCLVGGDWFGQFRFLSPALPFLAVLCAWGLSGLAVRWKAPAVLLAGMMVAGLLYWVYLPQASSFRSQPTVPARGVLSRGETFRRYADLLGLAPSARYLEPDVGGTSVASGLRIIDLAMLADIHTARWHYYQPFLKQYLIEEERPELVHTHGSWTQASQIPDWDEFRALYVPIWEKMQEPYGYAGDYVMRDLLFRQHIPSSAEPLSLPLGDDTSVAAVDVWSRRVSDSGVFRADLYLVRRTPLSAAEAVIADPQLSFCATAGPDTTRCAETSVGYGWTPALASWEEGEFLRQHVALPMPEGVSSGDRITVTLINSAGARELLAEVEVADTGDDLLRLADEYSRGLLASEYELAAESGEEATRVLLTVAAEDREQHVGRYLDAVTPSLRAVPAACPTGPMYQALLSLDAVDALGSFGYQPFRELRRQWSDACLAASRADATSPDQGSLRRAFGLALAAKTLFPGNTSAVLDIESLRLVSHPWALVGLRHNAAVMDLIRQQWPDLEFPPSTALLLGDSAMLNPARDDLRPTLAAAIAEGLYAPLDAELVSRSGDERMLVHGLVVQADEPDASQVHVAVVLEPMTPLRPDYRLYFHTVPGDPSVLPDSRRVYGFGNHDVSPYHRTSGWQRGRVFTVTVSVPVEEASGAIWRLGMYVPGSELALRLVNGRSIEIPAEDAMVAAKRVSSMDGPLSQELREARLNRGLGATDEAARAYREVLTSISAGGSLSEDNGQILTEALHNLASLADGPEERRVYEDALRILVPNYDPQLLGDAVWYLGHEIVATEQSRRVRLYFVPATTPTLDYAVWMHARPDDVALLPEDRQQYGFLNLDHQPPEPTSNWVAGRLYVDERELDLADTCYDLSFGFWHSQSGSRLLLDSGGQGPAVGQVCGRQPSLSTDPALPGADDQLILARLFGALGMQDRAQEHYRAVADLLSAGQQLGEHDRHLLIEALWHLQGAADDGSSPLLADVVPHYAPVTLGDTIRYLGHETTVVNGQLRLRLYWVPLRPVEGGYRIWMHGVPDREGVLPSDRQEHGFLNLDHYPAQPSSSWVANEVYVHTQEFSLEQACYGLSFGFWRPEDGTRLLTPDGDHGITLGEVCLG